MLGLVARSRGLLLFEESLDGDRLLSGVATCCFPPGDREKSFLPPGDLLSPALDISLRPLGVGLLPPGEGVFPFPALFRASLLGPDLPALPQRF